MTNQVPNPWDLANNAEPKTFEYFGLCQIDAWNAYFPGNGQPPVPFDVSQHPVDKLSAMIEIQIIPIAEQNVTFEVKRNMTSWSPAWTKITLPSIKALGLQGAQNLSNRFVRVTLVPTGRKWKGQDGEDKEETTFKFLDIYADEETCKAAYAGRRNDTTSSTTTATTTPVSGGNGHERETALKFARPVVENLCRGESDPAAAMKKVSEKIATMPLISKHFTGESPEIVNLIMEYVK